MPKKRREITTEEFVEEVRGLVGEATADELLSIPGIWEIVSDHYNNKAIENWQRKRRAKLISRRCDP